MTGADVPSPTDADWTIRTEIYRVFAESGRAPTFAELGTTLGHTSEEIGASVERLFEAHEIAPLPDGSGVWMANPFSAVATDYPVETPHMTCYSNCAWDALGVSALLGTDGWTRTHCAASGDALEFGVRRGRLAGDEGVIHLVTPPRDAWIDIGFT